MDIPLPTQFTQQPGGLYGVMNALQQQAIDNKIKRIQAQYAPQMTAEELKKLQLANQYYPLKTLAQAQSQLAYSNLAGPQYLSKAYNNPFFRAMLTEQQRLALPQYLTQAGLNAPQTRMPGIPNTPTDVNTLKNIQGAQYGSPPPMSDAEAKAYTENKNKQFWGGEEQPSDVGVPVPANQLNAKYPNGLVTSNVTVTPEQLRGMQKGGIMPPNEVPAGTQETTPGVPQGTSYERVAQAEGLVNEGKALGTERGKDIANLGREIGQAVRTEAPIRKLIAMTNNPVFANMRSDIPFGQAKQLYLKSKLGTKEEQQMVGNFYATAQTAVQATINGFKGRILEKEVDLANKLKPSENDTLDVIKGKLQAITEFNQILIQRDSITSDLMETQHMSRYKAEQLADKQISKDQSIKQISNSVSDLESKSKPTEDDIKHMMEKYKQPREEIVKRLKAKGIL